MTGNRIELFSPLQPSECASRLTAAVDYQRWAFFSLAAAFGTKPVLGYVTESSLRLRRRIWHRNPFQTFLTATMRPDGGGTGISGEFAMHPAARLWVMVCFAGVILTGGALFIETVILLHTDPRPGGSGWIGVAILPMLLAFQIAVVRVGRWRARNEARFLTDFLLETLDARGTAAPSLDRER